MIKLYSPDSEAELVLIKSPFDAEDIHYFVRNDHFGTLKVGPKIDLFNAKTIYVAQDHQEEARAILADFRDRTREDPVVGETRYTLPDKIRMVIETILFSWFVPGHRFGRKKR